MTAARTTAAGRVRALGRAELTLLLRNRTALAIALLLPVGTVAALRPTMAQFGTGAAAVGADLQSISGGIGLILLYVVYYNLVTAYVARREELVLKRLRTGEPTDPEILAGTALPAVAVALAQCVALIVAGSARLGLDLPHRPELLIGGLALGIVLFAALAAASTVFTRNVELAQLTTAPVLLVSAMGSGILIPLQSMPHLVGEVCRWLPLTPVVELIRAGWLGGSLAAPLEVLRALGTALAWTLFAVFAVHRWFRWEPRR
ncbi:ABC-2 type transport system permease protein [Streptacidiphilus sp. MAP12-16]|uniref:ABC transporter permease n=1 Tax=Streptacidiphilus sp. MAP12-16 TaxID=3156300 RepID=UPI0035155B43